MSDQLRVLLMQLPVPNNPATNVPLALGYLKAYAYAQGLLDQVAIDILPRHIADHAGDALLVREIVERQPDVLGASLYTWNSERTLDILGRVKTQLPQVQVIVGGPEVQRDNCWVLEHPAVDLAVIGEGEQTFADVLRAALADRDNGAVAFRSMPLAAISGLAYRPENSLHFTPDRVALDDLATIPSPYLLGYLDLPTDSLLMVEVSRWCPYACSFCLYGRNMGPKLGNRFFGLQRVLDEIKWGRAQGICSIHFIEANLNLVPLFWPLMQELATLNADRQMTFYAELRGEHLTEAVVHALDRSNVRYVEVGLQTANPAALKASLRRTDLGKWAAGTRRLYAHNIEVYLDVILGLPADDADGVQHTLQFIHDEHLGPYDIFTLQVLPGTAVRQHADQFKLQFQDRPPYYVLATDRFSYAELREQRRALKLGANLSPDAIEGMPQPRRTALAVSPAAHQTAIEQIWLGGEYMPIEHAPRPDQLANHVDLIVPSQQLAAIRPTLAAWIAANPSTIFDLYLIGDDPPTPDDLLAWRLGLPFQPGYLDRVGVYSGNDPAAGHRRVSPRCFVVLPWSSTLDPARYRGVAEVIWQFALAAGDAIPFGAWQAAGGGIRLRFAPDCTDQRIQETLEQIQQWEHETGRMVWLADPAIAAMDQALRGAPVLAVQGSALE